MIGITVPTEPSTTRAPDAAGSEGGGRGRSEAGPTPPDPRLDEATNSVEGPWLSTCFDIAGEATVVFTRPRDPEAEVTPPGEGLDPERAAQEAARRAATTLRRFIAHHRCDRFGTLTYRCQRCNTAPCRCDEGPLRPTDAQLDDVWLDIENFRRRLYASLGERVPLAIVIERHKDGALHIHFATNRYVHRSQVLDKCWGKGWTDIKKFRAQIGENVGQRERCRIVAAYMSSYLKKQFTEQHVFGRHRYSTTRGMRPIPRQYRSHTRAAARAWWSIVMGGTPSKTWSSEDCDDWEGPPVDVGYWSGDPP